MSSRDLQERPAWRGEELGLPLPAAPHGVSVALPRWQDVIGYEEKRPEVVGRMTSGYPRFVIHPLVRELALRVAGQGGFALPFPSPIVADEAAGFVRREDGAPAEVTSGCGVWVVKVPEAAQKTLHAFWQHTGLIVSSRHAEAALAGQSPAADSTTILEDLRQQLAGYYDCDSDDVFLAPTGMAAHFAAWRAVTTRAPGRATVQLGFPYVDTLKIQQRFGVGATLLHQLETAPEALGALLVRQRLAGCFAEIPGNPLLGCPDLRRVSPVLRAQGVPLIADDVVSTPLNVDLGPFADLIPISLTKYLVGTGDVMGGALVCNPRSPWYAELKAVVRRQHAELLWGADAAVLATGLRGFPARMHRHNAAGLAIAGRLRAHPAVERVWYPKWECAEAYDAVRRPDGGWSSLITFLPRGAEADVARVYDALEVSKGPSLGTAFTLACPFTLLAHFNELDWAASCGVPRNLIRLSVGLEEVGELWQRIERALNAG
jgi:cystathionine gamma-synthase